MLTQTPSQTLGPFFHDGLIFGGENLLVDAQTAGERITVEGAVFDGDAQPVLDAMIEIWQPDARGIFNHPLDPNRARADPHFRGFGRSDTVNGGHFWFKTIKPGPVAAPDQQGRAPYINVHVFARGLLIHALTRIYFSDEDANATDPVLNSIDPARRHTLIATREEAGDLPCYRFNIRLQGENETVFFNP